MTGLDGAAYARPVRPRDADQPSETEVEVLREPAAGRAGADVIESGAPRRRPPGSLRVPAVLMVLAVVVAAAAGYLAGHQRAATVARAPLPSATGSVAPTGAVPIAATGNRCAVQRGTRLQLGAELVNRSGTAVVLSPVRAVLPLGGLRVRAAAWGGCGQLSAAPGRDDYAVPAGGTAWLSMTFDVLVACPGPLPVQFTIDYTQAGRPGVVDLLPFPDLGDVPYTNPRCPSGS